jgi:hypothetical protein
MSPIVIVCGILVVLLVLIVLKGDFALGGKGLGLSFYIAAKERSRTTRKTK